MIPHTQIAKASDFLLMLETASAQLSQRCSSWLEWPSISYRQSELPRLRSHFPCKNLISFFLSSARVLGLVGVMSFYQELCESFMSLEPLMHRSEQSHSTLTYSMAYFPLFCRRDRDLLPQLHHEWTIQTLGNAWTRYIRRLLQRWYFRNLAIYYVHILASTKTTPFTTGLWFFLPLLGIYASVDMIYTDNFDVFRV